jgi:pimeloyl-ACP methyl ester carboxylesterase
MQQKLFFISGVGADKRAFSKLRLNATLDQVPIDWLDLQHKNESFESYCDRIIEVYHIEEKDCLIGLSFGGLVAQQIAKVLGNRGIILISSFRNKFDLQPLLTFGLRLKFHRTLPSFRIPILSTFIAYFLNSWQNDSKTVLKEMLKDADFRFLNWCIVQIDKTNLKDSFSSDFLCFGGTNDKLVSQWKGTNHVSIKNGSHFMVYDCADQISDEINRFLLSH